MSEIFAVIFLTDNNTKKAAEGRRDPRPFSSITYMLWFGSRLLGFIIPSVRSGGNRNDTQMHGMPAPSHPAAGQVPDEDISDAFPMRAVWLLAALSIFVLPANMLFFGRNADIGFSMNGFAAVYFSAVIGVCIYLFQQSDIKYKLFASGGLLAGSFVRAFSCRNFLISAYGNSPCITPDFDRLLTDAFVSNLSEALVMSLTAAAAALFICSVHKGSLRQKTLTAAAVSSILSVIYSLFKFRQVLFRFYSVISVISVILLIVVGGVVTAGFAAAAYLLGSFRNKRLDISGSARVWCIFCAAVTIAVFAVSMSELLHFSGGLVILQAAGTAGYMLMLTQKRIGFPAALCSALLSTAVTGRVLDFFLMSFSVNCLVLISMANPLICWVLIRKEWHKADS